MTGDGLANSTQAQPPISVENLKAVKDGYENLRLQINPAEMLQDLTVDNFPDIIKALAAMARQIGGFKALACCYESLVKLTENSDFEVLARCAAALAEV
jgi:hypothetical protein